MNPPLGVSVVVEVMSSVPLSATVSPLVQRTTSASNGTFWTVVAACATVGTHRAAATPASTSSPFILGLPLLGRRGDAPEHRPARSGHVLRDRPAATAASQGT